MCLSHDEFKRYKRQNDNCNEYMIQNSKKTKGLSIFYIYVFKPKA